MIYVNQYASTYLADTIAFLVLQVCRKLPASIGDDTESMKMLRFPVDRRLHELIAYQGLGDLAE